MHVFCTTLHFTANVDDHLLTYCRQCTFHVGDGSRRPVSCDSAAEEEREAADLVLQDDAGDSRHHGADGDEPRVRQDPPKTARHARTTTLHRRRRRRLRQGQNASYYYYYYYYLAHQHKAAGMKIKLSKNNDHDGILLGVKSA